MQSLRSLVILSLGVAGIAGALIPSQSQAQICPPGKTPAPLVFLCVDPAPDPNPDQIRTEIREFVPFVPVTLRPHLNNVLTWDDHDLGIAYDVGLAVARRFSGGMPGPIDPESVPDYQVKYWMIETLKREGGLFKVLIPIVRAAPDETLKLGYVRAVRLKRGQSGK